MKLNVSLLQVNLSWENKTENLQRLTEKIERLPDTTDLIVLPEMFTTGFTMNAQVLAEPVNGPTLRWLKKMAADKQAAITGSYIVTENGKFYNRLIWMKPDGKFDFYNKRHLFTLAKEHLHYQAGSQKIFPKIKNWKALPLICYDLRFPVWSRNTNGYDLLVYVANWPDKRSEAWKALLISRAIENQCYTIGVNCVGVDGKGYYYQGDSCIIDYAGKVIRHAAHHESILQAEIDLEAQKKFREKLPFLADQDHFSQNI